MFARTRPETCLSDLALDRLAAGELDADEHLASCGDCTRRLNLIRGERDRFLAERRPRRARLGVLASLLAAGLAFAVVSPALWQDGGLRRKGGVQVGFHVKHGDSVRPGADGEVVAPGDALRFTVSVDRPAHVAILSVDPAGVVSVYFPAEGGQGERVEPGQGALPLSTVLDETVGRERIYGVVCEDGFEIDPVVRSLRETGAPSAEGCTVRTFAIEKRR